MKGTMKTTLITVLVATLLGFAFTFSNDFSGFAEIISLLFAAGLTAWTVSQYQRQPVPLMVTRPIRLPIKLPVQRVPMQRIRQVA